MSTPAQTTEFSRKLPALFFIIGVAAMALHHWNATANREIWPSLLLLMSTIAGWSLGGLVNPAIFFAAGKYGSHLPLTMKILSGVFAAVGLATGMYMLLALY
jgi:hypothetical protein